MTPPLALEEAQQRLLALAPSLPVERCPVDQCGGFFLAEPLVARRTQPARAMSAMDGYAVALGDLAGPWRIVGESAAGAPFGERVGQGQAVRISTGALLPEGAAAIVLLEDSRAEGDRLRLAGDPPGPGRHIRRAGLDFSSGDVLLEAGTRLGAAQVALAIAAGHADVAVRRPVRLAVIDSGDELVRPGEPCPPHRLPASNAAMLAAMAASLPCTLASLGPIADDRAALAAAFAEAAEADVVVTSAGASVGEHDLIRPVLAELGASLAFWRVAIKPGKPLLVARRDRQVILSLPGNPASAFVTGFLFLLPLLRAALGASDPRPRTISARLGTALAAGGSRTEFLRGRWDGTSVCADPEQDSGALRPLAQANALIRRDIDAPPAPAGSDIRIYLLRNGGIA